MDDSVKQRLENQAFMAVVVGSGAPGLTASEWISIVVSKLGGFIGDVVTGGDMEPLRTVVALSEPPFEVPDGGSDIVPSVMGAFNERLATMRDKSAAESVGQLAGMLRRLYSAGGTQECSMTGAGFAFDFVRGRHMVSAGRDIMAMHVHGRTVLGRVYDSGSSVVAVYPDGSCELANGSMRGFSDLSSEEPGSAGGEIELPSRPAVRNTALVERIMKSRAGSLQGPAPTGMVVSRGEDGHAMLAVRAKAISGKLSVRFLPFAVQLVVDGKVEAQSGFDDLGAVLEWIEDGSMEVCRIDGDHLDWGKAAVEIRASA